MNRAITAFVLLAALVTVPAAYGQDRPDSGTKADAPARHGMIQMHEGMQMDEGRSMMRQEGMKGMMMGPGPLMILNQKEALGLDESQIERLEELQGQMVEIRQAGMESMKELHAETLGVLTDEQRSQVESGMKGMMERGMMMGSEIGDLPCPGMSGMMEGAAAPDDTP